MGADAWPPQDSEGMADHYAVLGVSPDANRSAIQAAYRDLARRHHPDFGGDGSKMAALNEAWSVLGRDETRLAYDATRRVPQRPAGHGTTPPRSPTGPISAAAARRGVDPRGRTHGFGRYADRTVSELAAHDPDYLEWLARAPAGLTFRQEIYTELARRPTAYPGRTATATRQAPSRSRFGRPRLW
jgi:curved DNA-binding protein CbpA